MGVVGRVNLIWKKWQIFIWWIPCWIRHSVMMLLMRINTPMRSSLQSKCFNKIITIIMWSSTTKFYSGQHIISKLVYQPWHQIDLYWRFTKWPKLLHTFNKLHNSIFDKLIKVRLEQGCDRLTLIDKLLRMMEETGEINKFEIKSECNTIMMAVSIKHLHIQTIQPITNTRFIGIWHLSINGGHNNIVPGHISRISTTGFQWSE